MNQPFEWNAKFCIGHPVIDEQHKKLFTLFQLATKTLSEDHPERVEQFHLILNDLATSVRTHFQTEEALLARAGFPDLEAHKVEHLQYESELTDLLFSATGGTIDIPAIKTRLFSWWTRHILQADMNYRPYLAIDAAPQPPSA